MAYCEIVVSAYCYSKRHRFQNADNTTVNTHMEEQDVMGLKCRAILATVASSPRVTAMLATDLDVP